MSDATLLPPIGQRHSLVLSVAFFLLVSTPLLVMLLGPSIDVSSTEKRRLAAKPQLGANLDDWLGYPARFEAYFNDRFGLRNSMIVANNYIATEMLGTSPVRKVIIGKEGWLYFAPTPILKAFRGLNSISKRTRERWATLIEARRDWLAERNIQYLFVVAPNKTSIYPQFLPAEFEGTGAITPLDQLAAHMEKNTTVTFLDLRSSLIAASTSSQTYYKTDTHWNHFGAHIGYQQIVEATRQWFAQQTWLALESFEVKPSRKLPGGLVTMLGIPREEIEERTWASMNCGKFVAPGLPEVSGYKMGYRYARGVLRTQCADKPLRVVVFRDSFFTAALPYFADQYGEVIYVWSFFSEALMEKILETYQPDLVIEERVERAIMGSVH